MSALRPLPSSPLQRFVATARALPLWAKWVLTLLFFALLTLWIALDWHTGGPLMPEVSAEDEINHQAQGSIAKDQDPHTSRLPARTSGVLALQRAVAADVRNRVKHAELAGPLTSVRCTPTSRSPAARRPFRCIAHAADTAYTFLGVIDVHTRALTWCEQDLPRTSQSPLYVEVSARCLR